MKQGVYVFSVLGESPSVLTELLWWLCAVERRPIAGIEAWATGRGARHLRELVANPGWEALQARTGPLPALQPDGSAPEASYGFRIHLFQHEDVVLDDVRSEAESAAVSSVLHDRVRELRRELPVRIPIVGSLAGGRKTVSAALQTAFCLQAGPADRLVHVLLDPTLESALREVRRLPEYCCPEPRWEEISGVAEIDQVVVYDVPFPRLRYLVPRRLSEVLERLSWDDVWPALDANMGRHARGMLRRVGIHRWIYEIVDVASEVVLYQKKLQGRAGALLAAMAHADESSTANDLVSWLDEHPVGWVPPAGPGSDEESRAAAVRQAATDLRARLEDIPVGLERFAPPSQGFLVRHVEAEWETY